MAAVVLGVGRLGTRRREIRGAASAMWRGGGGGGFYRAGEALGRRGGGRWWLSFTPRQFRNS
jgi:hypothetical protein